MSGVESEILEALLQELDTGDADLAALRNRFPGHAPEIERLHRALLQYQKELPQVEKKPGLKGGEELGEFVIERLIGAGGMGQVYRARQRSLGNRTVALKILPRSLQNDDSRKRFEREALLLAGLHHPNLAEVYGFGEAQGMQYIAMQHIVGRNLQDALGALVEGKLAPSTRDLERTVLRWGTDLAEALAAVHGAGLVHRDVKPSNVLLENATEADSLEASAILVDFGLVRSISSDEHTRTEHAAATPAYASPEQLVGLDVDQSSDIFSLGVVLHDLLARRSPRTRGAAAAGLEPLRELVPELDPDLASVVSKMLETEIRWRYANASELLEDLRALDRGQMVSARHPPLLERCRRWLEANPLLLVRAGSLVVLLFLLALGLSSLMNAYFAGREAHSAWSHGDVMSLLQTSRSPGVSYFVSEELQQTLASFTSTPSGALGKVAIAAERGDISGALREAAIPLRRNGIASDAFLLRYLERALHGESGTAPPYRKLEALRVVARLYFERPVTTLEDQLASRVLRDELLERWALPDLPLYERLAVLSAFTGIGELEDVLWILTWCQTRPTFSEEARLAFSVCDGILRRALILDQQHSVDPERLLQEILSATTPAYRALFGKSWNILSHRSVGVAAGELARSFAVFRRANNLPSGLEAMLPNWKANPKLERKYWVSYVRAAMQDPEIVPAMEEGRFLWGIHRKAFHSWALPCGLLGDALDEEVTRQTARAKLADVDASKRKDCLEQFELGLRQGRELLLGIARHIEPDEDTRLGAELEDPSWKQVEPAQIQEEIVREGHDLVVKLQASPEGARVKGRVFDLSYRCVRPAVNEWGLDYFLMSLPGISELRMGFEVQEPSPVDWVLHIEHQVGARSPMPYKGEVAFDIVLDGRRLDGGSVAFVRDRKTYPVTLPRELISTGTHQLSVRLLDSSNTTFRLHGLELLRPRDLTQR